MYCRESRMPQCSSLHKCQPTEAGAGHQPSIATHQWLSAKGCKNGIVTCGGFDLPVSRWTTEKDRRDAPKVEQREMQIPVSLTIWQLASGDDVTRCPFLKSISPHPAAHDRLLLPSGHVLAAMSILRRRYLMPRRKSRA